MACCMNPSSIALTAPPKASTRSKSSVAFDSSWSVSDSMKYEPAKGSTVSVMPDSLARICWVRRAIMADSSVGRPSASSYEFKLIPQRHRGDVVM